jgi:hypothetical protein
MNEERRIAGQTSPELFFCLVKNTYIPASIQDRLDNCGVYMLPIFYPTITDFEEY